MSNNFFGFIKGLLTFRWKPGKDLVVVGVSWIFVVASLYTATVIVGAEIGGGIPYFLLYAVVTATLFGIGLPVYWMVFRQKRPIRDLGITRKNLLLSLILQVVLAGVILPGGFEDITLPPFEQLAPLICLALAIGFFEAIFWRGWVLLRLEEAFGFIPAALIGSVLYAAYHIGYEMPLNEMVFLFFIGFGVCSCFSIDGQYLYFVAVISARWAIDYAGQRRIGIAIACFRWISGGVHRDGCADLVIHQVFEKIPKKISYSHLLKILKDYSDEISLRWAVRINSLSIFNTSRS
jgi:membrane protease YdiL (CAAX protease family)